MKKLTIDSKGNLFEGNIFLTIKNLKELNNLFFKLFGIKGIKAVYNEGLTAGEQYTN
jgi:hypothetical protein